MMEISGLWKKDHLSGQEGFTLAAALLLGKDEEIQHIIPHYKIDALVRINNLERYDDRLYIQSNLIDAYDMLLDFVNRHLPDKFYLEGAQRINLRATIFREIVANLIIHPEYTSAAPATFIIYSDRVETSNANNPHGKGPIDPANFVPFPKNPSIAKFFIQLGRAEELGSGILTTSRLMKEYAGNGRAMFIEGRIFRTIIPRPGSKRVAINDTINDSVSDTVNDTVRLRMIKIIRELAGKPGLISKDLAKITGVSEVSIRRDMQKLTKPVEFKGAPKTGGYFLTDHMLSKLKGK